MATLINNSGVQYYANKMVQAENRKVGSKSLPTALNDIDSALDEMKNLFDTEYGSELDMKLENSENVFSVGAGSGVDKRDEVENSFTDVELKGNTLVNLFGGGFTYTSSIIKYLNGVEVSPNATARFDYASQLKKDVKYTAIVKVDQVSEKFSIRFHTANTSGIFTQIASSNMSGADVQVSTAGIYKVLFTPQVDSIMRPFVWNTSESTINLKVAYILILEGDWTNKTAPDYFEGIKSVGESEGNKIEILSRNKNLFNINDFEFNSVCGGVDLRIEGQEIVLNGTSTSSYTRHSFVNYLDYMKDKTTYTLSGDYMLMETTYNDGRQTWTKQITTDKSNMKKVTIYLQWLQPNTVFDNLRIRPMLEEGSVATTYVTPSLNKKEILLNEPLRGLPNGVKDSIEKINGEWKIIRRCGEISLDGNEQWANGGYTNIDRQELYIAPDSLIQNVKKRGVSGTSYNNYISNNFPTINGTIVTSNKWLAINGIGGLSFALPKTELVEPYVDSAKQWLSRNPTKLIYELEIPIIEDISPVILQTWKNGTISIDSVIPVESTHTVALNKPAQIKRNIEELTQLRNKVKSLEEQYDQIALEQAHQLELINHSFELDYI